MNLHWETLSPEAREVLQRISELLEPWKFRLVGGTGLALHLGHRKSIDLDLFSEVEYSESLLIRIRGLLQAQQGWRVEQVRINEIGLFCYINSVKVDIVCQLYRWIDQEILVEKIRLATPLEIAAMKISAIGTRGSRKDFIDFYFLTQEFPVEDLINAFKKKYPNSALGHYLQSLLYFADADEDPTVIVSDKLIDWLQIKKELQASMSQFYSRCSK